MNTLPEEKLRELCGQIDGTYGLYVSIPHTGEKLVIHGEDRVLSASTIKIPLLALLLKDGEEGRLDLTAPVAIRPENRVGGSGILQSLGDVTMSLFDHGVLMMVLSDNISTNQVIDAVGMDRANAFFADQGWTATRLNRKMMSSGEQNYTSVRDLGDMLERMLDGTLVSKSVSDTMLRIMAGQRKGKFRPALPAEQRLDPHAELTAPREGRVVLSAKSGLLHSPCNVSHDAGVLLLPGGRSAVLVMTTFPQDEKQAETVMGQVARTVYEALL